MTSNECFRAAIEAELGVPVKLFTPADYDGVIQGLLGGTLDYGLAGGFGLCQDLPDRSRSRRRRC